jgi:hypothetical protein
MNRKNFLVIDRTPYQLDSSSEFRKTHKAILYFEIKKCKNYAFTELSTFESPYRQSASIQRLDEGTFCFIADFNQARLQRVPPERYLPLDEAQTKPAG